MSLQRKGIVICSMTLSIGVFLWVSKRGGKERAPIHEALAIVDAAKPEANASWQQKTSKPITPEEILERHNLGASALDMKVRFWGKLLDQDERPITGADIKASVTTLRMVKTEKGYREYEVLRTKSGPDGSFKFDEASGLSLTIESISMAGYVLPSAYQAGTRWEGAKYFFRYNGLGNGQRIFHPDESKPVVFHLWKLTKPAALIIWGSWMGSDGPEFRIGGPPRVLSMAWTPGTDIDELGVERDISVSVRAVGSEQSPEWEVTVASVEADGGIAVAAPTDIFLFRAPEVGYERVITMRYGPVGADEMVGDEGALMRFYVRSKSGRWHSAVEIGFFKPTKNGIVRSKMRHWLNPSGSRNLEHDAAHPLERPDLTKR